VKHCKSADKVRSRGFFKTLLFMQAKRGFVAKFISGKGNLPPAGQNISGAPIFIGTNMPVCSMLSV